MTKILVTGCSGFIGMHLCESLLKDGYFIFGIDNMNDYYSVNLKKRRLQKLKSYNNFKFESLNIASLDELNRIFLDFKPNLVANLAAQAGVRYSLKNPSVYIESNVAGFMNILEASRHSGVEGVIYASSSSVYGGNKKIPFSAHDRVDKPISIYAASKKANELMAYTYSHLYNLNTTGLRFFTVYGPWGRPDMAMYIFAKKMMRGEKIQVYNHGNMERDFTYIDDIVQGVRSSLDKNYNCEVFNLGNSRTEKLLYMIECLEKQLGLKAIIEFLDIQPGDVQRTCADIEHSKRLLNYNPKINLTEGISNFINWFKSYKSIR